MCGIACYPQVGLLLHPAVLLTHMEWSSEVSCAPMSLAQCRQLCLRLRESSEDVTWRHLAFVGCCELWGCALQTPEKERCVPAVLRWLCWGRGNGQAAWLSGKEPARVVCFFTRQKAYVHLASWNELISCVRNRIITREFLALCVKRKKMGFEDSLDVPCSVLYYWNRRWPCGCSLRVSWQMIWAAFILIHV